MRSGQGDDHAAPVRIAGFGMDLASVEVDDPTSDGQAETGTTVGRCARSVGAVKAFEDSFGVVGRNAGTLVEHFDSDGTGVPCDTVRVAGSNLDGSALGE